MGDKIVSECQVYLPVVAFRLTGQHRPCRSCQVTADIAEHIDRVAPDDRGVDRSSHGTAFRKGDLR